MAPPAEYHRLQLLGRPGPWRPLVGIMLLAIAVVVLAPLVALVPLIAVLVATGEPVGAGIESTWDLEDVTPMGLAYVNLILASAIPVTILINLALHGLAPGWLVSVARRVRWRFFLACFGLSVLALIATVVVSSLVPQSGSGAELSGHANAFTTTTRNFLLVVLILTPLQAAGEEFAFRGYLMQALGGLFPSRALAVVLSALLFALAHGFAQDLPIFVDRFAFGLVAGALVILTGGLEAAIAMHVLNNFLAFGLALAFADMSSALNPTGGSWWSLPGTLTQSLVYLALATWLARRMGLATTATPAVLEAPRGAM
ncbi:MAG: Abortive infection protein [Nocardioides sp.]|jgi:membrane protease YdiL (CAAX protease family)|uniref:CPBP family intramembrane glutamic endopeptidase n=1 Tax=Nocardioides sp. TaxID=35761 RepID=UPI002610F4B2|nr:CPBP family intramembrane glutamic endopeptidase [Nocardioides sp.]MCW2834084.1 Abortive infection protein [Nocardioides sp.]